MTDDQLIAAVKFLVGLRAENLALWRILRRADLIGSTGVPREIAEERQRLEALPVVADALTRNDLSQLPTLLSTLSAARPQ